MLRNRIRSRASATRMQKLRLSCTLLIVASILVLSSAGQSSSQRKLRGNKLARRRAQSDEPDQKTTVGGMKKYTRIIGGAPVQDPDRYPWFTQVWGDSVRGGFDACGGALIAKDLVLTAAHCGPINKANPGRHNRDELPPESIDALQTIMHPLHGTTQYSVDFDISIVHLSELSEAEPVRLNFNASYPSSPDESLEIIGHGSTLGGLENSGGGTPNIKQTQILHTAETLYVPFDTCAVANDPETGNKYGNSPTNTLVKDHWFCTTGPPTDSELTTSTCYGDSGGPVFKENFFEGEISEDGNNDLLLAVISGTSGYCGNKNLPLWNQRVSYHKQWIIENGCALSQAPPAEWNCDQLDEVTGLATAPLDNSVYVDAEATEAPEDPTEAPVEPTEAPVDPTDAPVADPTFEPSPRPTTEKPIPFPVSFSSSSSDSGDESWELETDYFNESGDFVCPICVGRNRVITNPDAVVYVPVQGKMTCQELVEEAALGKISEGGECDSILIMTMSACNCVDAEAAEAPDDPTEAPVDPTEAPVEPTEAPVDPTEAPVEPTEAPVDPTEAPVEPTDEPTEAPVADSTDTPVDPTEAPVDPTESPTNAPTDELTESPTLYPTETPDTCEAIRIANEARDPNMMVDVTIDFSFDDVEVAKSVGWYLSDPGYECFRVGVRPGRYSSTEVSVPLKLVQNVEYRFVLNVIGERAIGTYNISSNNATLAHNLLPGRFFDDEGSFFMTPKNPDFTAQKMVATEAPVASPDDFEYIGVSDAPVASPDDFEYIEVTAAPTSSTSTGTDAPVSPDDFEYIETASGGGDDD